MSEAQGISSEKHRLKIDMKNKLFLLDGIQIIDSVLSCDISFDPHCTIAHITLAADVELDADAVIKRKKI